MVDRIGYLSHNKDKHASDEIRTRNSIIVFAGIFLTILLISGVAGAETVTYYLNATGGVDIGADGITNVITGSNQHIPPAITALLDKTGLNSGSAQTNDHPEGLYNHSRWYFTSNYPVQTKIDSNPSGKIFLRGGPSTDKFLIRLYDYNPLTGSKTLIGSTLKINITSPYGNNTYSYTIYSPTYIVSPNNRLMLQFDFDQIDHNSNARIYANQSSSYLTVNETPLTYNVTINSTPSFANITAGTNFTYNITVNNTGIANGSYSLSVSDSDATNFLPSVLGTNILAVPAGGSNQTTITVTANRTAPKDAADTTTITATSIENSIFTNITQIITTVSAPAFSDCGECHESYSNSVNGSNHNQTINAAAPNCTLCHTGYELVDGHTSGNKGYTVNESNTCRNCHIQNVSGFYERHTSSSDCTSCHFANTTRPFDLNVSLFTHDHNLTVENNFYEYNQSGMPVRTNGGLGVGMFPYYTCTLTCHKYNATTGIEGKVDEAAKSWFNSSHARSLHMSGDNKISCARCKSPANFNISANQSSLIAQPDWQGIQCRVCHNLHDRKFPNNTGPGGFPVAFYNSTASSLAGYPVYEAVPDTTVLCQNCHAGTSHDSKFAGTHKDSAGFNCTNCHMNSSFNKELHKFEVKNTTSNITGCEVCHDPANHTFQWTSRHTGKVECVGCHDQTISRNTTGYAVSQDNNYGIYKDPIINEWTTYKVSHSLAATWPLHNLTKEVSCIKCHNATSVYSGLIASELSCSSCHTSYYNAVIASQHNSTKNIAAPNCTLCHTGYEPVNGHTSGNKGYTVNESNTCRNCHVQNESGFYERHTSSSDCTSCHFANTTRPFDLNQSTTMHDHNLTVEYNFYEYNQSGMPVRTNGGLGVGMFPYYTCTLTCHRYNATSGVEGKVDEAAKSWLNSSHARSLHMSGDNKMSCARCKSPANFNISANQSSLIAQPDWQGIQCRVCHNLHDRKFPNNTGPGGFPVAFYNSTASSLAGYPVYEAVPNNSVLCQNCHAGTSHDSKFAGTHKDSAGFNCTNCHMNSSFNQELHTFEVKNTTSGAAGCEVCHKAQDHTVLLCKGNISCVGCHDQTITRNATGYAVSPDNNYGIYYDNATNNWTTYKISHDLPVSWPLHNISRNVTCEKCHGSRSVYSGFIAQSRQSCDTCHYQPPNGSSRYNTDGAHTRHNAKGYGTPETGCDYCHFSGGRNETGHPNNFDDALILTNDSASIRTYIMNSATGSDDTCSGVSCHTKGLIEEAKVGTATWNSSTAGTCSNCHSTQASGSPPTGSHTNHTLGKVSCATCHGNNSDSGKQAGHRTNSLIDINLTGLAESGNYNSGTCTVYCHHSNPNDIGYTPTWNMTKIVCGDCHSIPPTNFTMRDGRIHPADALCDDCHGGGAGSGTHVGHRNGLVDTIELRNCLSCHDINGTAVAKADSASFGMHRDINNTDGGITKEDCNVCHFNITGMFADYRARLGVNVYDCTDCHKNQTVQSKKVSEHIPGANMSVTTMKCEDCHVNSINIPDTATTINTSIGKALHYGTMTNLVKPTAGNYNAACDNCHNSSVNKTKFGAQNKQIYTPHTGTGKCNMCHIPAGDADTLHNKSLSMPPPGCKECHTIYASKYKAPNITETNMASQTTCNLNNICHRIDQFADSMGTLARHNIDMTYAGTGGSTDTVYLNNQISLTVAKGTPVNVTSRVNDSLSYGGASRVGGAEYYIDVDPGQGKGIPMNPTDGFYDSLGGAWESVNAAVDTNSLLEGTHIIFVRGMDIGKQWSVPKSAMLIVNSFGYINGTVTSGGIPVSDATVSTNGASSVTSIDGNYSLLVINGIYDVTASKQPTHYDNTSTDVVVTPGTTKELSIILQKKENGTISGVVRNY